MLVWLILAATLMGPSAPSGYNVTAGGGHGYNHRTQLARKAGPVGLGPGRGAGCRRRRPVDNLAAGRWIAAWGLGPCGTGAAGVADGGRPGQHGATVGAKAGLGAVGVVVADNRADRRGVCGRRAGAVGAAWVRVLHADGASRTGGAT